MKKPASKQYQASMKKPDLLAEESTKKPVSDEEITKKSVSEKESMKLREDLLATIENDNVRAYWEVRAERHVPCSVVTNLKWRPTRKDLFQDNVQPQLTWQGARSGHGVHEPWWILPLAGSKRPVAWMG
jgi:hypothetical protein